VKVYTPGQSVLDLSLGAGFQTMQIRDIGGIGPVASTVSTIPYGGVDGETYSGVSRGKRNITMILGLNPDWSGQSMSSLRHLAYLYFMTKQKVTLRFISDELPVCEIVGYVESCEPNIFSRDPEMLISIVCPDPDFVAIAPTVIIGTTGLNSSEFFDFEYNGTVPTGYTVTIESTPENVSFVGTMFFYHYLGVVTDESQPQILFGPILVDETHRFEMSTIPGKKYIRTKHTSFLDVVNLLSDFYMGEWPHLGPGANRIAVSTGADNDQKWTLTYSSRFGGL